MNVFLDSIDIRNFKIVGIDKSKATAKAIALLSRYLKKTVQPLKNTLKKAKIYVGIDISLKEKETIRILLDKNLYITGGCERAVNYAVSVFLEKYLGWRFYNAEDEKNVLTGDVCLEPFEYLFTPRISMRYNFSRACFDTDIMYKQRCNFIYGGVGHPKSIVAYNTVDGKWGHTYFTYVSPDEYFTEHPEYFSMGDSGERENNGQLCLSNDDVFEIVLKKMREKLISQPNSDFINFSQNDNGKYCKCPKCTAINEKFGSLQATNLIFVNKLAEKLCEEFSEIKVMTLAYQWSEKPPVGIPVRDNVYIFEALMNKCLEHKLTDKTCRFNPNILKCIYDWASLTKNIFIWCYITDFDQYTLGLPKLTRKIYEDFRVLANTGIKGIMFQNNVFNDIAFADMWGYVGARLAWNPDMTYIEYMTIVDEYLLTHFGKAKRFIAEYIDLTCEQPISTFCYNAFQTAEMSIPYDMLPDGNRDRTYIDAAKELLDAAYDVAENSYFKKNVDKCRLAYEYYVAEVTHDDEIAKNPEKVIKSNRQLYNKMKKYKIDRISEFFVLADAKDVDFSLRPHEWTRK